MGKCRCGGTTVDSGMREGGKKIMQCMDCGKIDSIIPTFQKGVNRIIIFDDASWGRDLSDEEVQNLMARLTYILHDLQTKEVIGHGGYGS